MTVIISKLFYDGKRHRATTDYAVIGWRKAFRIVDGEHLKTRLNVVEPECARTLKTCDLSAYSEAPGLQLFLVHLELHP
jgi:hypothetical protein